MLCRTRQQHRHAHCAFCLAALHGCMASVRHLLCPGGHLRRFEDHNAAAAIAGRQVVTRRVKLDCADQVLCAPQQTRERRPHGREDVWEEV
eukprot:6196166-Pleurochrysis_carterae.AAC.3